ncbi:MAG TPA: hypothetical protein VFL77_09400 [Solirubrobacterales bacterium]|nr:hypothetical protein [Solirubrobacterales bacterium]
MGADATCAICGRTILPGERVHGFVAAGEERSVCELCVARAERLGWRPAGEPEPERAESSHEGRWRLGGLLGRRRRPGAPAPNGDPAAPPRRSRPAPAPEFDAPSPFELAVARFNSSEPGRTVAGLARTLGRPQVSLGAAAGAPDEVRITVAWELSWYQWGVDVGDELRPVFELDKGREIDQLDAAARQWNAAVDEDGRISLAGEPAPR